MNSEQREASKEALRDFHKRFTDAAKAQDQRARFVGFIHDALGRAWVPTVIALNEMEREFDALEGHDDRVWSLFRDRYTDKELYQEACREYHKFVQGWVGCANHTSRVVEGVITEQKKEILKPGFESKLEIGLFAALYLGTDSGAKHEERHSAFVKGLGLSLDEVRKYRGASVVLEETIGALTLSLPYTKVNLRNILEGFVDQLHVIWGHAKRDLWFDLVTLVLKHRTQPGEMRGVVERMKAEQKEMEEMETK